MRELRHVIGARAGGDDYDDEEDYGNEIDALPMPTALPTIEATGAELREDAKTVEKLVADVASLETLIEEAVDPASADTKRNILLLEKKRMRLARIKTNGTGLKGKKLRGSVKALEITDDMNISGSLSIKYGSIGGAGKGSFVDSDKFKESGLNFFISVKVINQSINIKDALVFQGLPSVDQTNFRSVFGDCYIAGFLEGGEFNTLVSMKVVNKAKAMSTKAEAEVALSVGAVDLKATAKVDIDKSNFSSQTETTIQVGWSGGGHIKPSKPLLPLFFYEYLLTSSSGPAMDNPIVDGDGCQISRPCGQYTSTAILTKYESLRSFMALKPPALTPMYYENASIYTNALLDESLIKIEDGNPILWNASIHATFAKPFAKTPKVAVWFTEIIQPKGHRSLKTYVADVSPTGM
ncbi:hypothetical protein ACHAP4_010681 [Fusarium culmorum]